MKFDIRLKLVTFTFGVVLLVGGSIALYFIYLERQRILTTFEQEAREATAMISRTIANDLYFLNLYSLRLRLEEARMDPDISYLYATDLQGVVLADGSGENARQDQRLTDSFSREMLHSGGWISRQEEGVLKIGGPILAPDNRRIGYLHTGFSLRRVDEFVHRTTRTSFYITLICLGIGALLADFLSMAFSRPILSIARAAKEIGGGRLDTRLSIKRGDEVGMLAESINQMADQIQHHLQRITALREIGQAITTTLDLRTVLDLLLEKIDLSLPYPAATVRLFNKDSGLLEPVACRNLDEAEWKTKRWKGGRGLANAVFEAKSPLIILDCQTDPRVRDLEFYRKHRLLSYLGIPLMAKGEVLGVLSFYTKEKHEFSREEIEFLSTLAGEAAVAINNSRLYEETERRRREAEELARVAQSLTETLDMTAVGERIVTSVRELFGVRASMLRLLQPDGSLRAIASSGEGFLQDAGVDVLPVGMGLVGRVVAEGRPIWSADVLNDPEIHLTDQMRDYQVRSGNRSMIAVPLRAHERIIGSLGFLDRTGRVYSDDEVALLQTFADQAAIAINNSRLFEEVQQKSEELEKINQELLNAHQAKSDFLNMMSHELRTPLNTILARTGLLEQGAFGDIADETKKALKAIQKSGYDLLNLINETLDLVRLEAKSVPARIEEFSIKELMGDMEASLTPLVREKGLELKFRLEGEMSTIQSDKSKIKQILQNLLSNAIKYTDRGEVELQVRRLTNGGTEEGRVSFSVRDTGIGIRKEDIPHILEPFQMVEGLDRKKYPGSGLGLSIVKRLVELLGGEIQVESAFGKGSTLTVILPIVHPTKS